MSKAEERALEAYPPKFTSGKRYAKRVQSEKVDTHAPIRKIYLKGYETAEKDLALTWEDVQLLDHFVLELVREEKEGKDWGDGKEFYTEVLTRFKQYKEEIHD